MKVSAEPTRIWHPIRSHATNQKTVAGDSDEARNQGLATGTHTQAAIKCMMELTTKVTKSVAAALLARLSLIAAIATTTAPAVLS